ncbi:hypothetical protein COBT_000743 [Conglomerata obtusa]
MQVVMFFLYIYYISSTLISDNISANKTAHATFLGNNKKPYKIYANYTKNDTSGTLSLRELGFNECIIVEDTTHIVYKAPASIHDNYDVIRIQIEYPLLSEEKVKLINLNHSQNIINDSKNAYELVLRLKKSTTPYKIYIGLINLYEIDRILPTNDSEPTILNVSSPYIKTHATQKLLLDGNKKLDVTFTHANYSKAYEKTKIKEIMESINDLLIPKKIIKNYTLLQIAKTIISNDLRRNIRPNIANSKLEDGNGFYNEQNSNNLLGTECRENNTPPFMCIVPGEEKAVYTTTMRLQERNFYEILLTQRERAMIQCGCIEICDDERIYRDGKRKYRIRLDDKCQDENCCILKGKIRRRIAHPCKDICKSQYYAPCFYKKCYKDDFIDNEINIDKFDRCNMQYEDSEIDHCEFNRQNKEYKYTKNKKSKKHNCKGSKKHHNRIQTTEDNYLYDDEKQDLLNQMNEQNRKTLKIKVKKFDTTNKHKGKANLNDYKIDIVNDNDIDNQEIYGDFYIDSKNADNDFMYDKNKKFTSHEKKYCPKQNNTFSEDLNLNNSYNDLTNDLIIFEDNEIGQKIPEDNTNHPNKTMGISEPFNLNGNNEINKKEISKTFVDNIKSKNNKKNQFKKYLLFLIKTGLLCQLGYDENAINVDSKYSLLSSALDSIKNNVDINFLRHFLEAVYFKKLDKVYPEHKTLKLFDENCYNNQIYDIVTGNYYMSNGPKEYAQILQSCNVSPNEIIQPLPESFLMPPQLKMDHQIDQNIIEPYDIIETSTPNYFTSLEKDAKEKNIIKKQHEHLVNHSKVKKSEPTYIIPTGEKIKHAEKVFFVMPPPVPSSGQPLSFKPTQPEIYQTQRPLQQATYTDLKKDKDEIKPVEEDLIEEDTDEFTDSSTRTSDDSSSDFQHSKKIVKPKRKKMSTGTIIAISITVISILVVIVSAGYYFLV